MQPRHISALDGLRGIAALIVVISHSANAGFIPGVFGQGFGQFGVALFYILSAFLIAYLYVDRPFTWPVLKGYGIARIARVFPLYYVVVLLGWVCVLIWGVNFYGYKHPAILAENALLFRGTTVLWSVPVEIHYYIVFVFLWWAHARGWTWRALVALIAVNALMIPVAAEYLRTYRFLFYWLHFFIIGYVFAHLMLHAPDRIDRIRSHPWTGRVAWIVVLCLPIALPQLRRDLGWDVPFTAMDPFAIVASVAVFLMALLRVGPVALFESRLAGWFGAISFSIYLLHWPIVEIVGWIDGIENIPGAGFVLVLALTLSASALSHRFIERPAGALIRGGTSRKEQSGRRVPS